MIIYFICIILKTIFKIPTDEIVSIDISKNCNFIATLANKKKEYVNEKGETVKEVVSQKITLWELKPSLPSFGILANFPLHNSILSPANRNLFCLFQVWFLYLTP